MLWEPFRPSLQLPLAIPQDPIRFQLIRGSGRPLGILTPTAQPKFIFGCLGLCMISSFALLAVRGLFNEHLLCLHGKSVYGMNLRTYPNQKRRGWGRYKEG
jgi:hypothetical protein